MSFYRIFPGLSIAGTGMEAGPGAPEQDAPQGVRAQGTRPQGRARTAGHGRGFYLRRPAVRSKGPEHQRGVAALAARAVGCADHDGREATGVSAPLMPWNGFRGFLSILCRKLRFARAFNHFKRATIAISLWATVGPRGPHPPLSHVAQWPPSLTPRRSVSRLGHGTFGAVTVAHWWPTAHVWPMCAICN